MLKKDLLELCILNLLEQGPEYGYELLRKLHDAFPNTQESGIYAILRDLCRDGYTRSFQGTVSGGPSRKYYELTAAGEDKRVSLLDQWRILRIALEKIGIK